MTSLFTSAKKTIIHPPAESILFGYLLVVLAVLFGAYWCIINPPPGVYFTLDEQFISDSGVFLLYGASPRCLEWPAVPMVLVYYLLALLHCGFLLVRQLLTGSNPVEIFKLIDQSIYAYLQDRTTYILIGRTVQLLLTATLMILTIRNLPKSSTQRLPVSVRDLLIIVMVVNSELLISPGIIRPEAIAYGLCLYIITAILFTDTPDRWFGYRLMLITALLINQRMIFLILLPFILGSLILRTQPTFSWKSTGKLVAALVASLVLTNPFFATDTLIHVKAFAGGIIAKVAAPNQANPLLAQSLQPVNAFLILLTLLGFHFFRKQYPDKRIVWLYMANMGVFALLISRSAVVYPTHTLPLRILGLVPLAFGGIGIWQLITRQQRLAVQISGSLFCLFTLYDSLKFQVNAHQLTNYQQVVTWLNTLAPQTSVLLPPDFEGRLRKNINSLKRELSAIQDAELSQAKLNRFIGFIRNKPDQLSRSILFNEILLEDERLTAIQHRILVQHTPPQRYIDPYFYSPQVGFINYYIPSDQALSNFDKGTYAFLISENPLENRRPERVYNQQAGLPYYVYKASPETMSPDPQFVRSSR
ncbi:hypothetical protein [Nibrella viscosa]